MKNRYPYPPYGYDPYFFTPPVPPTFKTAREEIEEWEEWLSKRKKDLEEKEKNKKQQKQGMSVTDWLLIQAFIQPFLVLAYIHFIGKLIKP